MTRTVTALYAAADMRVLDVRCSCPEGHVDEEESSVWEVVLPTSGMFRRRTSRGTEVVDASSGYIGRPGGSQRIEHVTHGDRCIAVLMSEQLADELGVPRTDRVDRSASRGLVASARRSVDEESWLDALSALLPHVTPSRTPTPAHRRAVDSVRAAIAADPGAAWDLRSLGRVAGYAPHHLSRIFRRVTGTTITDHRDGVRLARAAELVADGEPLADVAAQLGFADHSHLTRRAKAVLGVTPSQLRG